MPYSSGTFSLYTPGNPVVTGTTIASTWANNTLSDIATGLTTCVLKDGTQTMTANLPMGGFKLTGLGAGTAAGNSVRYEQVYTATALTDQATITWDASLAPVATVTLTASRTMAAPTNLKTGGTYTLIVTQNATGGWTLTWNAVFKAFGGNTMPQPETTLSTSSAFTFVSPDGTNLICTQCVPFIDTNYFVRGGTDPTKKIRVEADGLTTATTRVWTALDQDWTIGTATQAEMEAASSTSVAVTPGRQQNHPGMVKFRVRCDAAGNISESYNVTSITDTGTGRLTVTIATDFSNTTWNGFGNVETGGLRVVEIASGGYAAGTVEFQCRNETTSLDDPVSWSVGGIGDQ